MFKILGYLLYALPFIGLAIFLYIQEGLMAIIFVFGSVIIVFGLLSAGSWLINHG